MTAYSFRLYVNGQSERSVTAEVNLRALCESHLTGSYEIDVVDVAKRPVLAEDERVLATPTVVRLAPLPQLRAIGDLSDHRRTARALGVPGTSGAGVAGGGK